jgi:alginate O-acetyltransferase complex protein AlgI
MAFNSYTFFVFFIIVLAVHYSSINWQIKKVNLLVASYTFYAAWHPPFVFLLLCCTLVDWFAVKGISASKGIARKRIFLIVSLTINLGLLVFFKYANFFLNNFVYLLNLVNIQYQPISLDIVLPLGISFFTFQSLTYTFDVYRHKTEPWPYFLDFALFVTFFPKLVIGPITRAVDFLPQIKKPFTIDMIKISWGFFLLLLGLFEKIIMADNLLAPIADMLFNEAGIPNFVSAWTGTLAFTGQIFFDFAGYSTCAIGVALCLGFTLPQNFKYPYAAIGFSDFWRRWHITLSSWFRDYLYISMGGNKKGETRTYINIFLTMLVCGLWHGASWTFIVWGGLHGLYQVIEKFIRKVIPESYIWQETPIKIIFVLLTFIITSITWVLFRADSFEQAFRIIGSLLMIKSSAPTIKIDLFYIILTLGITLIILISHWIMRDRSLEVIISKMPGWLRSLIIAAMIIIIITCSGEDRAFIYFQF